MTENKKERVKVEVKNPKFFDYFRNKENKIKTELV